MCRRSLVLKLLIIIIMVPGFASAKCQGVGRFVNPITDICWSCLFPLSIGNIKVSASKRPDTPNPATIPCMCNKGGLPVPGIPVGFWEPVRLADVTRHPYCMVSLGGISLGDGFQKTGANVYAVKDEPLKHSFYHVHWYIYPLIYWLEILVDFLCLEQTNVDVVYLSEFDPLWNNDELNLIINPEAALFSSNIAQIACGADCLKANINFPSDSLFWCAGCNGGLYPFMGKVEAHVSGVQASSLLVERTLARLHRVGLAWRTSGKAALCQKRLALVVPKTQYKLQMTYPVANTKGMEACNVFGHSSVIWGSGKEFPTKGEDFGYLIWRKRNCCLL
ncbi:MAG: conjugal transfer pilus assembly protein TraU [Pseudomonadota bacterium]